jgi:nucleoside-diphosphate-sugar epimerase
MKNISILGCGWLGFPLAKQLISNGFFVKGSTTSENKLEILLNNKVTPFLISLFENEILGDINGFLKNSKILITDIPPKLRNENADNFVSKIKHLISFIENSGIENVIFVSSTSVYSDDNLVVTEKTIPKPETESGKQLLEVEKMLFENKNFQTCVIRFGGLIGDDRNPIQMLSAKKNLQNPDATINLIHQDDCIGMILKIIETNSFNEIFNGVAPFHPTRKEYYSQKALFYNLKIPQFDYSKPSIGKTVSSEKVQNSLNYTFLKPNL